ncbi:hypothetical protein C8J57DRAFT_6880 [Mycena rebaudengoi]|nr:hypothetical protein C8J57DRAFT_6880 [Mycena rebaudengoi]
MIMFKLYILSWLLAGCLGEHVAQGGASELCDAPNTTAVACYVLKFPNQTFFSPANSGLPQGTYIAASLAGAHQLAEYLDTHPNVTVTNLLLSDSTIQDLATDFGYEDTYRDFRDLDWDRFEERLDAAMPVNRNISRDLEQTILDFDAVSSRIMDGVAPTLESLSYLTYIRIWDDDGYLPLNYTDNRVFTVLNRDFPRLTHLTLRDPRWKVQNLPGTRQPFRSLPALTHLHLVTNSFPSLSVLRRFVPSAAYIRLSGTLPQEFSSKLHFTVQWAKSLIDGFSRRANSPIVIAQPQFSPMRGRGVMCGNPGIEHSCLLARLARNRNIHLSLPAREDYDRYAASYGGSRLFPFSRAITEFEDRLSGGGPGEWAIPEINTEYSKQSLAWCH